MKSVMKGEGGVIGRRFDILGGGMKVEVERDSDGDRRLDSETYVTKTDVGNLWISFASE